MTDSTTPAEAAALLKTPEFKAFEIDGLILTARVVLDGMRDVIIKVDGKNRWAQTPQYFMVFEGGKWGSHRIGLEVSSPERLRGHWDGYKQAHQQEAARRASALQQPAGARYKPEVWVIKVGDRVFFHRGMFGLWMGKVTRVYEAAGMRKPGGYPKGTILVDLVCKGANGRRYEYKRYNASTLTRNGVHPTLPEVV
jgi:hypothetical protein